MAMWGNVTEEQLTLDTGTSWVCIHQLQPHRNAANAVPINAFAACVCDLSMQIALHKGNSKRQCTERAA